MYRVEGPARLKVVEGSFYALGRVYSSGCELVVPRGITVCLKVEGGCTLEGVGSVSEAKPEEEVIDEWRAIAESIATRGRVVVVGETDSGKTTFSTYLINVALSKGLSVALIDADVGQNDVGWPGTIALAFPEHPISWLGELDPAAFYFVGANSPMGHEDAVILGVSKLLKRAEGRDLVVVNTDGWVADKRALAYKCRLVESIEPTTLVVMRGSGAADPIARIFEGTRVNVVRAPTPPAARGKVRELRKMRRELSYLDLLAKSSVKSVSLDRVKLWASYTFNGQPDEGLSATLSALLGFSVFAETCGSAVVVSALCGEEYKRLLELKEQLSKLVNRDVMVTCLSALKGYLVGLVNASLEHVGVGVLEEVDPRRRVIKIRTPFEVEGARLLIVGRLRLSESGAERERGPPPLA